MRKFKELLGKIKTTLKQEGLVALCKKSIKFVFYKITAFQRKYEKGFKDVLFINGCTLPHPQRYRVTHQIEQLEAFGISCDRIDYDQLNLDMLRYYRAFIFYRCPILPVIEEFIKAAKENNKTCFYDIDDLVFDLEYTNQIKYLNGLNQEEKDLYNDGVIRMGKTLDLCEYGIASTERLQKEMSKHVKEVYINRNVASEEMLKYSSLALKTVKKEKNKIIIGYLSGSITHNDDFKMIMPSIIKILETYENVYLQIVGLLELPPEMEKVKDKVITAPFMDYRELPKLLRFVDINLAPLEDSIFNEAKSENKWMEAALVKTPTIASSVGAFKSQIKDERTGLLCQTEKDWELALKKLIEDEELRIQIGEAAYQEVMQHHTTLQSGRGIAEFVKSKLKKNICFVIPSTNISGGVMVTIKHGLILKKNGYDVTLININKKTRKIDRVYENQQYLNVVSEIKTEFLATIDTLVATMWLTLDFVRRYPSCLKRKYLVQGRETGFYDYDEFEKLKASATYNQVIGIKYITISKWCQKWLKEEYGVEANYARNGIDLSLFPFKERNLSQEKIQLLIEGNNKDPFKNVDEAFKIVERLDKNQFEIHYLSYEQEPKSWYHVDHFYQKVPHEEVGKIYQKTDILLKTSLLESFSYPPLEMMATGGICLVVPNEGNVEYLIDQKNCLFYEQGNVEDAVKKLNQLVTDKKQYDILVKEGLKTAKERDWKKLEKEILTLYEE